jgi:hypothetical protein
MDTRPDIDWQAVESLVRPPFTKPPAPRLLSKAEVDRYAAAA